MEKLIELLNEYWEYDLVEHNWEICKWDTNDEWEINIYTDYTNNIISKKFWFIKWLVDNDKIKPLRKFIGWETDEDEPYIQFDLVDQYIAYLSIQDNPIEFLISILK